MYKNIDSKTFEQGMQQSGAVVLDVRTEGEIAEGIIPGAINIDLMGGEFAAKAKALDPEKEYYVYCRSGNRSGSACSAMSQWGFKHVYNLADGMMGWTGQVVYPQATR